MGEIKETQAILRRLQESLEAARNHADPFGAFVFQERREYRKVGDVDNTKNARRTRQFTEDSFRRAMDAGWRGDYHAWVHVLKAYAPEVANRLRL